MFPDPKTGGWWRQFNVNKLWAAARDAAMADGLAKCPCIHGLRHTHAAWLITDNVPLLAVSRRLGHESIRITADTYGHLLPEADGAIREALSGRRPAMGNRPKAKPAASTPRGTRKPANRSATSTAPANRPAMDRTPGRTAGTRTEPAA